MTIFSLALCLLFIALKLADLIDLPWWSVLLPLLLFCLGAILHAVANFLEPRKK